MKRSGEPRRAAGFVLRRHHQHHQPVQLPRPSSDAIRMPDNDRPGCRRPGVHCTALQVRPLHRAVDLCRRRRSPPRRSRRTTTACTSATSGASSSSANGWSSPSLLLALVTALVLDDDADADLPRDDHAQDRARGGQDRRLQGRATRAEEYGDVDFYRTQYELLKSRTLAERVVEQLNLRRSAPATPDAKRRSPGGRRGAAGLWASATARARRRGRRRPRRRTSPNAARRAARSMGSLIVEPIRNSRLVRVHFDSPDRRLAADALNALAQNFIAVNLERRFDASSYAKTFLEEKLAQTKAKLEESERALVDFQRAQRDHQRRREAERARADAVRLQRRRRRRRARSGCGPRRCTRSSRRTPNRRRR